MLLQEAPVPVRPRCAASAVPRASCLSSQGSASSAWRRVAQWRQQPRRRPQQQRGLVVARAGTRDPFEVLGVGRGADAKAIKAAYRRKALKLHPDVNKAPNAKEQFMEAKQAFQALTEGRGGTSTKQNQAQSSSDGFDWRDPFRTGGSSSGSHAGGRNRQQSEEQFYGFTEFFGDLEKEWGDRKKRRGKQDASLWEELADIGEEFVEFLEHELGLPPQAAQEAADNSDSTIRDAAARKAASEQQRRDSKARAAAGADRARTDAAARAEAAARQAEEEAKRAEQDVEDMLADLKRKMNN